MDAEPSSGSVLQQGGDERASSLSSAWFVDRVRGDGREIQPHRWRVMEELPLSGSASLSIPEIRFVKAYARARGKNLIIVDLMRESHGVNEEVSITNQVAENAGDGASVGRSERLHLRDFNRVWQPTKSVALDIGKQKDGKESKGTATITKQIESESTVCASERVGYNRLSVENHEIPDDAEVKAFLDILNKKRLDKKNTKNHLHVHCNGGKGRTATFLAIALMMLKKSTLDEALEKACGEGYEMKPKVREFLERFESYAKEHSLGSKVSWSAWNAQDRGTSVKGKGRARDSGSRLTRAQGFGTRR